MENMIDLIIFIGVPLLLLVMGWGFGSATERAHLRNLTQREQQLLVQMRVTQVKSFPGAAPAGVPPQFVVAEVVIASDYLKSFLAKLRNFFGGEMHSLQTLMDRARREVMLRLAEQARAQGYNALCNVRLDTADIGSMARMPMAAIIGSATAYHADP